MATRSDPLSSGFTGSGGSRDPISSQFSQIRSLIGPAQPASPGVSAPSFGAPSPTGSPGFTAGSNSSDILRQGFNLLGGAGTGLTGAGTDVFGQGLNLLNQPTAFYQALLSGDPTAMQNALAPTAAAIKQQFVAPTQQATNFMPRGGYAASTLAELPFAQAGQVGNAALGLQKDAASAISGIGKDVAGLGQGEQQLGLQQIQQLVQAALGKMGVTTGITGNLANVGQFLSSII